MPSQDAESLVVSTFKNWEVLDLNLCGWCQNWGRGSSSPRPQPQKALFLFL